MTKFSVFAIAALLLVIAPNASFAGGKVVNKAPISQKAPPRIPQDPPMEEPIGEDADYPQAPQDSQQDTQQADQEGYPDDQQVSQRPPSQQQSQYPDEQQDDGGYYPEQQQQQGGYDPEPEPQQGCGPEVPCGGGYEPRPQQVCRSSQCGRPVYRQPRPTAVCDIKARLYFRSGFFLVGGSHGEGRGVVRCRHRNGRVERFPIDVALGGVGFGFGGSEGCIEIRARNIGVIHGGAMALMGRYGNVRMGSGLGYGGHFRFNAHRDGGRIPFEGRATGGDSIEAAIQGGSLRISPAGYR